MWSENQNPILQLLSNLLAHLASSGIIKPADFLMFRHKSCLLTKYELQLLFGNVSAKTCLFIQVYALVG